MNNQSEKIGVRRITIEHPDMRARAVVGSFFAVDALLMRWSARVDGVLDCRFLIEYHDGCTIGGAYRFERKGGKRPALMLYVRAREWAVSGLADGAMDFLDVYDTEDFAMG